MAESIKRQYGFLFCVGAEADLARLCPGGDLSRLREVAAGRRADTIETSIEMVCILSRWHEKARALECGPEYVQRPLEPEELKLLTLPAFAELQAEAMAAVRRDSEQTVEAQSKKKDTSPKLS